MKKIITLYLAVVCAVGVAAQNGGGFSITYPIAFPLGDLNDYTDEVSFRGISMEYNWALKSELVLGIEAGWNVFYKHETAKVYTEETTSIAGVQYRYVNAVPLYAGAKYYKDMGSSNARPFAGLGIGTLFVNRSTDFGLYRISTETWQFAFRPELGVKWETPHGISYLLGVKYHSGFGNDDLDAQSYLTVNVGIEFGK